MSKFGKRKSYSKTDTDATFMRMNMIYSFVAFEQPIKRDIKNF